MSDEKKGFWSKISDNPIAEYVKDMVISVSLLGFAGLSWKIAVWIIEIVADLSL